ncbi:Phospholipase D epsilon [Acorus calamus]|uniref:phospholipase D n=1 Tax=Acorus calamus TaxID=4465 RepID=A0AAV9D3T8_ACOCL|nr:Phospholipase D epsilon [Acorus calamus]
MDSLMTLNAVRLDGGVEEIWDFMSVSSKKDGGGEDNPLLHLLVHDGAGGDGGGGGGVLLRLPVCDGEGGVVVEGKHKMFLHGTLEATIFHAKATTTSPFSFNCLFACDKQTYVTISLDDTRVAETTHEDDRSWNQTFRILCAHSVDTVVTITIRTVLTVLGRIRIPGRSLVSEESKELRNGSHPLLNEKGKPVSNLDLRFVLRFTNAESETYWGKGLGRGDFRGITKGVSFPQRSNCRVTLYQDAHHSNSFHPPLFLQGGETYRPGKLWEDVYKAIDGAKHLVYIAGWSFNPNMVLAKEGVAVRVMLWDDETSLPVIKNKGVMRTHDEDAFDYFKRTKVILDDEYILIGSANVNQRSMDGRRDTEIAIGEDCVRRVVELGEEMWRLYSGDEVVDMEGVHLVNYPISVMEDGSVEDLPQSDGAFPDTRTPVKGRRSKFLPPTTTQALNAGNGTGLKKVASKASETHHSIELVIRRTNEIMEEVEIYLRTSSQNLQDDNEQHEVESIPNNEIAKGFKRRGKKTVGGSLKKDGSARWRRDHEINEGMKQVPKQYE